MIPERMHMGVFKRKKKAKLAVPKTATPSYQSPRRGAKGSALKGTGKHPAGARGKHKQPTAEQRQPEVKGSPEPTRSKRTWLRKKRSKKSR